MKFDISPMYELKHSRDQLALEFFSIAPATDFLKKLMPGILSSFTETNTLDKLPELIPLNKDQHTFLKVLNDVPFSEIGELRAYTPEGMCKKYLEYLHMLSSVTQYIKNIQKEVLQPYTLFLAQLVSDKQASITTNTNRHEYDILEKHREEIYKKFSTMYSKDSYKAETIVKKVVDRNADWKDVFVLLNKCTQDVKSVDRELVKRQVQQCTDYLGILKTMIEEDKMTQTSREAAARLANGAFQIAKTCELFSTTYYRTLTMNGSIENTIAHIVKTVG